MKITQKMVIELNNELLAKGIPFRFKFVDDSANPHIEITLPSMNCVDSFIINPSEKFYSWLKLWFKVKNIELTGNNVGSVFWSKNGWNNDETKEVTEIEDDTTYYVTYKIDARYIVPVTAKTLDDAKKKAENEFINADFGEATDIDGEIIVIEDNNGDFVWEKP